jgi:hypothetical protein
MDAHEQPDGVHAVGYEHRSGRFDSVNDEPLHTYGRTTERQHLDPTSKNLHDENQVLLQADQILPERQRIVGQAASGAPGPKTE